MVEVVEVVEGDVSDQGSLPGEQGQSEAAYLPAPAVAAGAQQFGGIRPGGDTAPLTSAPLSSVRIETMQSPHTTPHHTKQ